ncbi:MULTISPECIES: LysR family transcriptional regulator [Paenibacillus]|uniref:LysR family transcriptional regulator n=1 Tax=Paenibacillus naphthalenovorans TaxID=162209 RepID=A0A0U2MYQ3_9BACL|nr:MULTISPECIES: LysR family transcriptional regulator [Paenibacillus]ALS23455.1 LysR family transcriptional regulator [Paenibacillus naphthalenovorans]NTZ17020.1 LysR family transcriptional regulator [Paenibacillus sp. JMULE4]GCL72928.1 LysR family transcriptional regulator [Paenibacillus naphthalenovorans]SDJ27832.1 DNA-binding transcriptional regulator, LysR family [Paenibacillus naphthalenovorans]
MELIDVFAAVVEQQSLNKASQLLNISQPALSRKIMRLEEELGVQLFKRIGKRLELTRAGEITYEYALDQQRLERKLHETLQTFKTGVQPASMIIGASLTTLQSTLPDLITMYMREYPNTDIKAITGKTHEIVPLVKDRKVDIGLVASKIDDPSLTCVPLFDDHLCLVLPDGHSYTGKTELKIHDLHGLPMILFSRGTWYRVLMDEIFQRYAVHPDVKMEIDSFEAITRLVSTCNAGTLLPESYLRRNLMEDNQLTVRYIPELKQTKRTTSLLYTDDAVLQTSIGLFIDQAVRHYQQARTVGV